LAEQILGGFSLDAAYETAKQRQAEASSVESRLAREPCRLWAALLARFGHYGQIDL